MKSRKPIPGLEKLRRFAPPKQRSIPLAQRSTQTELYVLSKEKEHHEKERERLLLRLEFLDHRLQQISQETHQMIEQWKAEISVIHEEQEVAEKAHKAWRTKVLKY